METPTTALLNPNDHNKQEFPNQDSPLKGETDINMFDKSNSRGLEISVTDKKNKKLESK